MAHNLQPDDLLYPKGELPITLFPDRTPGKTAQDALQFWLDQAQSLILNVPPQLQDGAARFYCYANAFRAEANRLAAMPNSTNDSGNPMSVSTSWGADRIQYWENQARRYDALFLAMGGKPQVAYNMLEGGYAGTSRSVAVW